MFNKFVPPIEKITDEVEFAKVLLKAKDNCSYFTEQFLGTNNFDYNVPYLNCEERFVVYRCIEENEFVYCKNGIKQVNELKNGDEILGGIVNDIHKFKDELLDIRFQNGVKIKVNLEHPFYTKNGWKDAKDLTVKDEVEFTSSQYFRSGVKSIGNLDIVKLMGYLHSDGSICNGREVRFTNTNKDLIDDVIDISTRAFDITVNHRIEKYSNHKPAHRLRFINKIKTTRKNSNPLMRFIRENNMMQKDTFGETLLSLPKHELQTFVNGYFNGDGSLIVYNKDRKYVHIKFCIGNKKQRAYEFQYILWKLGIDSIVIFQDNREKSTGRYYEVAITKINNIKKILQWIDKRKYPEKFKKAEDLLQNREHSHHHKIFSKIKSIENCGSGNVVGFEVNSSHEIYSYLGMKTHNSGRQCGKSRNAALKALHFGYFASEKAGNLDEGVANVVIASLSKDQANLIFKKIRNFIHKSTFLTENIERETKSEITLKWFNGAGRTEFIVRPIGDTGDSLRGWTTHMAILDEAGYIPEVVYNAFLPSTVTTKPRILLTSTPKGKAGKFFQACEGSHIIYEKGIPRDIKGNEDKKKNPWIQFHVTTYDNPLAASDPEILALISNTTEAAKKQELMGEFIDGGNALVPYDMLQHSLIPIKKQPDFICYDLGVDTSGKGQDETVLITSGITEDGESYPVDVYTELTTDQTELAKVIKKRNNFYKYRNIFIDSTGIGDTLLDCCNKIGDMPTYGINFKSDKTDIYVNLARIFNDKMINLSLLENLHKEKLIDQLSYMYWEYGDFNDQAPKARSSTKHDDYPDSLALVLCGQREGDFIQNIPNDFLNPV